MYRSGILNSRINRVVGDMGHTDCLCVGDCGLPVPENVEKIDVAVRLGSPTVDEILTELSPHLCVEKILLAQELKTQNPKLFQKMCSLFPNAKIEILSHVDFKKKVGSCRAMIRTGDNCAYANIILQSGCVF